MKRTMCLWLPNWPIQRVRIETQDRRPLVLFATRGEAGRLLQSGGMRGTFTVTVCSRLAAKNGVRPGMPLGEAESLLAGLAARFLKHDAAANRAALRKLARECHRYTPIVALEDALSPECVLLDIAGSSHLFGGERGLAATVWEDFSKRGYSLRLGIADGIGAAWAAAHSACFSSFPPGTPGGKGRGEGERDASRNLGPLAGSSPSPKSSPPLAPLSPRGRGAGGEGEQIPLAENSDPRLGPSLPLTPGSSPARGEGSREGTVDPSGEFCPSSLSPRIPLVLLPPQRNAEVLPTLPVECLRLAPPVVRLLHQFDLRLIRQLLALPRSDILVRFGEDILTRLDQALGIIPEILTPEPHVEPVRAAWAFDDPVDHPQVIEHVLERLFRQIVAMAEPRQVGVQRLYCSLTTADRGHTNFSLGLLHPTASVDRLRELLRLRLETVRLPAEVVEIQLRARVGPLEIRQPRWFEMDQTPERAAAFRDLVERLSNRLGDTAVVRPILHEDDQPEFAWEYVPWLGRNPSPLPQGERGADHRTTPQRPTHQHRRARLLPSPPAGEGPGVRGRPRAETSRFREGFLPPSPQPSPPGVPGGEGAKLVYPVELLSTPLAIHVAAVDDQPCRLAWRQRTYVIAQSWGPQRIDTGWWRGHDVHRDYYRVETDAGERFWLFRDRTHGTWFLHGIFA
jgi:protein ImuB